MIKRYFRELPFFCILLFYVDLSLLFRELHHILHFFAGGQSMEVDFHSNNDHGDV